MKKIFSLITLTQQQRLRLLVLKLEMDELLAYVSDFIGSRITMVGLLVYPPNNCKSYRLESDPRAVFTMNAQEQENYWQWLARLRNHVHAKNCRH